MYLRAGLAASLLLLIACGRGAAPVAATSQPGDRGGEASAALQPPALRLPASVRPRRYQATLTIDPARSDFDGDIAIDVAIAATTETIWLHGDGLRIDEASAEQGGRPIAVRAWTAPAGFVALRAAERLAPGEAQLRLRYRGSVGRDGGGVGVHVDRGDRYVVASFGPSEARRAFPCFDEPSFKVPWQVTLRVPPRHVALGNAPEASSRVEGDWKVVDFEESAPLPSHRVAFAVGPFEVVDAGHSRAGAPQRVFAPRGRAEEAEHAARAARDALVRLEDELGMPYPYRKLDHVVQPGQAAAGGGAGLLVYGAGVLADVDDAAAGRRIAPAVVRAQALQWTDALVTPAWWDDQWMGLALARWAEARVLAAAHPGWGIDEDRALRRNAALAADADKGALALAMIERWIGTEAFRAGVRAHLARHAHGVATAGDLAEALDQRAGLDVGGVLDGVIGEPSVPQVAVALRCAAGKAPLLELVPSPHADLPVCVRWRAGGRPGRACVRVTGATALPLTGAGRCPEWVMPNDGGAAAYRLAPSPELLASLMRHLDALTGPERIALAGDVEALVAGGVALDLAAALGARPDRASLVAATEIIDARDARVAPAERAAWASWLVERFGRRARALGLVPRRFERPVDGELRPLLLHLAAELGGAPELVTEACALAQRWRDDEAPASEARDAVLAIARARCDR